MNDPLRSRLQKQMLEQADVQIRQVSRGRRRTDIRPDSGVFRAIVAVPLRQFIHFLKDSRHHAGKRPFAKKLAHDLFHPRKNSRLAGRTSTQFVRVQGSRSTAVHRSGKTASARP